MGKPTPKPIGGAGVQRQLISGTIALSMLVAAPVLFRRGTTPGSVWPIVSTGAGEPAVVPSERQLAVANWNITWLGLSVSLSNGDGTIDFRYNIGANRTVKSMILPKGCDSASGSVDAIRPASERFTRFRRDDDYDVLDVHFVFNQAAILSSSAWDRNANSLEFCHRLALTEESIEAGGDSFEISEDVRDTTIIVDLTADFTFVRDVAERPPPYCYEAPITHLRCSPFSPVPDDDEKDWFADNFQETVSERLVERFAGEPFTFLVTVDDWRNGAPDYCPIAIDYPPEPTSEPTNLPTNPLTTPIPTSSPTPRPHCDQLISGYTCDAQSYGVFSGQSGIEMVNNYAACQNYCNQRALVRTVVGCEFKGPDGMAGDCHAQSRCEIIPDTQSWSTSGSAYCGDRRTAPPTTTPTTEPTVAPTTLPTATPTVSPTVTQYECPNDRGRGRFLSAVHVISYNVTITNPNLVLCSDLGVLFDSDGNEIPGNYSSGEDLTRVSEGLSEYLNDGTNGLFSDPTDNLTASFNSLMLENMEEDVTNGDAPINATVPVDLDVDLNSCEHPPPVFEPRPPSPNDDVLTSRLIVNSSDFVRVFQCDNSESFRPLTVSLAPGAELRVCIRVINSFRFTTLVSMAIYQGEVNLPVIEELTGIKYTAITSQTIVGDQNGVYVSTRVPSNMFNFANGNTITVAGRLLTALQRRLKVVAESNGRELQVAEEEGGFRLDLTLVDPTQIQADVNPIEPTVLGKSAATASHYNILMGIVFAVVFALSL